METFTSRDGTRIACFRSGTGTPLVLVHGTSADHTRWTPLLGELGRRFTVYACDRRGRGESGDAAAYAIEREVEDVAAVVDAIGGPVDLLGHSHGAICALGASLLTRNLRRLVLYEPPIAAREAIPVASLADRLQALLDAGDREGVVIAFLREGAGLPPEQLERMRSFPSWKGRVAAAHTIVRELRANETFELRPEAFREMRTPALLLLGGASPPFFAAAVEKLRVALPDSRVTVLPGQHHVAMDTAPDLFLREVIGFLER